MRVSLMLCGTKVLNMLLVSFRFFLFSVSATAEPQPTHDGGWRIFQNVLLEKVRERRGRSIFTALIYVVEARYFVELNIVPCRVARCYCQPPLFASLNEHNLFVFNLENSYIVVCGFVLCDDDALT